MGLSVRRPVRLVSMSYGEISRRGYVAGGRGTCGSNDKPWGITVLELLVVMALIAVVLAVTLPAINSARETARRTQCASHLRQVGLAMQSHHARVERLPIGLATPSRSSSARGWATEILPDLEAESRRVCWVDAAGSAREMADVAREVLSEQGVWDLFLCPSDIIEPTFTMVPEQVATGALARDGTIGMHRLRRMNMGAFELPTANYIGVFGTIDPDGWLPPPAGNGPLIANQRRRFRDFVRGMSATMLVGERTMFRLPSTWLGVDLRGEDAAGRLLGAAFTSPNEISDDECGFSSRHPGGANFAWGDGHVSLVTDDVDPVTYQTFATLRTRTTYSMPSRPEHDD